MDEAADNGAPAKQPTRPRVAHIDPATLPPVPASSLDAADRLFAGKDAADPRVLATSLAARLEALEAQAADDPTANPILRLALHIGDELAEGAICLADLEQLIQYAAVNAFDDRARRLRTYLGETDRDANTARLAALFRLVCRDPHGATIPFQEFRRKVEAELLGIVITAHPTFSMSGRQMQLLNRLATCRVEPDEHAAILAEAYRSPHRPDSDLSLDSEQALSVHAIGNIRWALRHALGVLLDVAEETYPGDWRDLVPKLATTASWVGYDLDGRTDISFADMLAKRLASQASELESLQRSFEGLRAETGLPNELAGMLDTMAARLELAKVEADEEIAVFSHFHAEESESQSAIRRLSRNLAATHERRALTSDHLLPALSRAIAGEPDAGRAKRLAVLRAELATNGIAQARTHVRINATQLHNAIRKAVSLDTAPDDPRYRQSYVSAINGLIEAVQPVSINFGSLLAERTSAKRLFMTIAQMVKYTDSAAPIRFLIAECETAFTPLVALYYARLFGIAERLEICPLFETEKALQVGSRVIEQLVENPHFRAQLQAQRRLCIQTGYSDAGRFIGQPAATGSIERLKERIVRVFDQHDLQGIELMFFDTHGESVGRGGHPDGIAARLDYVQPPHVAASIARRGIAYKQEVSFQGGDGYLPFMNEEGALAVVTAMLEWRLLAPDADAADNDPFYRGRDYITEFLTIVKAFQTGLIADGDYAVLLATFGPNLLYRTGSRATKREDASEKAARPQISRFRAIPHNAILQQLGMLTNTLGGVGAAIERDPQHFRTLRAESPRFRGIIRMVEYAEGVSNPDATKAYIDTLDPGFWLLRAAAETSPDRARGLRLVADALEEWDVHSDQVRVFRKLLGDFILLRDGLTDKPGCEATLAPAGFDTRTALSLLNAVRLALIHELYMLGTRVPEFSSRNDAANLRLYRQILQLDIPDAVTALKRIFPTHAVEPGAGDFGEDATYRGDDEQTYEHENAQLFDPMLRLHELIRRISTAVAYRIGFIG